ncbi:MAG: DUF5697 family protein [Ruminococcus sp.]
MQLTGSFWISAKHLFTTQAANFYYDNLFSEDDEYEIIYVQSGKELLINRVYFLRQRNLYQNRLLVVSSLEQARQIQIPNVIAFCTVGQDGKVSYYRKGR